MPAISILDVSLGRALSSVPTDPGAIFAYVLIAAFVWFIWKGSRPSTSATTQSPPSETGAAKEEHIG
jgi:hypothetical protein